MVESRYSNINTFSKLWVKKISIVIRKSRIIYIIFLLLFVASCFGHTRNSGTVVDLKSKERIGVLRSIDRGATWVFLGHADFNSSTLIPVDPSPLAVNNKIALYFLDLAGLGKQAGVSRVIYRADTSDGLQFTKPIPIFSYHEDITDPYVLRMPDGSYRLYAYVAGKGIVSAWSVDGFKFVLEDKLEVIEGGTPGAVVTFDHKVRLFLVNNMGVMSVLSDNGLTFSGAELGLRISRDSYRLVSDPHPISLQRGGYLMSYISVSPAGRPPFDNEIRLASSTDGFVWTKNSTPLRLGANPGLVEASDGTLYIFFVDFHASN